MGTIQPGDWKRVAIGRSNRSMSPDECKKRQSGFWKREYDAFNDIVTWTCDKRKLHDKVAEAMSDLDFREQMASQGTKVLDRLFGEGTEEAFRHQGHDRVCMRFDNKLMGIDLAKGRDEMALWSGATSGTFTTTTTSGTAADTYRWAQEAAQRELQREVIKSQQQAFNPYRKTVVTKKSVAKSLVRNLPLVAGSGDLVNTLQREFNHWASLQMQALHG